MMLIEPIHADFNKNISDRSNNEVQIRRISVISVPNQGTSKPYQGAQNQGVSEKAKRGKPFGLSSFLVRLIGLEPTRREAPDPKSGLSTNFTTSAYWEG